MAATGFRLARLVEVCTPTHRDSQDPDHRHNALHALKLLLSAPGRSASESVGNKEQVLKELKDIKSFDECLRLVLEVADDKAQHARTILQAAGRDHDRQLELEVKNIAASLIAPLYFHYYLAGHDSPVVFDYIFRLLATEDRCTQFADGDPNALLLLPQVKRGYARTAFSSIVDMVKLHAANAQHLAAGGWGECAAQQRLIIRRVVEALNPAASNASKLSFSAILSPSQIQKDINVSLSALTMVFQCLDVPQICSGIQSKAMFALLRPLIAPADFKYSDGGAFRRRVIQCAVALAMFGQSEDDFHPWHEIMEQTLLVRLQHLPAVALKRIHGDKARHEYLTEQKDLINGLMFVLKVESNVDRETLPSVAASYFSNSRNLVALVDCLAKLNAFAQIEDFQMEFGAEDCYGHAVGVTAACCNLLQAVCCRFPLSCTVEESRGAFFNFAESALPMEDGNVTRTPVSSDADFGDDGDFDFDDTPSRSSSVDESDPISEMYIAAIRLDATLVQHSSSQLDGDMQRSRLINIMMQMYRKTSLESRVKSEVLACIPLHYNLACFTEKESEFFAANALQWNPIDGFLENVPSALVAIEFMDKVISSEAATSEARKPFLNLTFEYVSQVAKKAMPKYFSSNEVVRRLMNVAMQFLLHAAPQWTRGGVLKTTVENSEIVETILTILKNSSSSDARNVEVTSCCLNVLKRIVDTGAGVSFHQNIFQFLLDLFASSSSSSSLKFSVSDFLKSHFIPAISLSKSVLQMATAENQAFACRLLVALLEYGRIRQDSSEKVFVAIADIAQVKKYEFSAEVIQIIQEQAIGLLTGSDVSTCLLSMLSCVRSILNFCKCSLDGITPPMLLQCFKTASQNRPPDFEVCSQVSQIASLYALANDHPQFSELLEDGIGFLSSDCCDFTFIEALSALAASHRNAPMVIEKAVAQMTAESKGNMLGLSHDVDGRGSKKMKNASSASTECTLPSFLSVLYGHVEPSHPLRTALQDIVKRCLQTPGVALVFGMQCMQFVPQQTDQLAACLFDQADKVLNAFANMTVDQSEEELNAVRNATAAFLLVHSEEFASKLFHIVDADVAAMIKAAADEAVAVAAAAVAFPKFLFFRKVLGQWIERSIVKVVDGEIQWHGGHINRNAVVQKVLSICFQIPLSSDGPLAAISTVCVGILSIGLFLDLRAADGECAVLNFALENRSKIQAIIVDVVLASMSNSNLGSNPARDGMSQAFNHSVIRMLQLFSIDILPPAYIINPSSPNPELTGSDVNTKLFKSALLACIAAVDALGSTMPIGLFQEIATASVEFLRRFSTAPTTVQIWKAWEAFGRSAMGWPSVLVKACIRQDVNDGGYTLRDFTHSLRFLALDLLSKVASAALFRELNQDLQKNIIQSIISHLDDFRPEVADRANQIITDFFKLPELRALMKRQDICDILCADLNGITKTFPVFDEIAKAEPPNGTSPADQQLKAKKVFVKATIDQRLKERTSRILNTVGIVQALLPQNSLQ